MSVVVGYSTKPEGQAALTAAIAEARLRSTSVLVVPNTDADDPGAHAAEFEGAGVAWETRPSSPEGAIAENLMEIADAEGAELIVIGLRRRSPTGKLLLGMHAQRVLLDAGVPVLAVKGD
ncbi:universal stress protein [Naumannella huperziae]